MGWDESTLGSFTGALASASPAPGGGGASAAAGALAAALASMVANLTAGKEKYAMYAAQIEAILPAADRLRKKMLALIDEDEEGFRPLAATYRLPADTPDRAAIMDDALRGACRPPMEMARLCCRIIRLHEELAVCGSVLALSDVGVGAALAGAALRSAGLNVLINAKSLSDPAEADALRKELRAMQEEYIPRAERVLAAVEERISR